MQIEEEEAKVLKKDNHDENNENDDAINKNIADNKLAS